MKNPIEITSYKITTRHGHFGQAWVAYHISPLIPQLDPENNQCLLEIHLPTIHVLCEFTKGSILEA
jgi:hypothetical protein